MERFSCTTLKGSSESGCFRIGDEAAYVSTCMVSHSFGLRTDFQVLLFGLGCKLADTCYVALILANVKASRPAPDSIYRDRPINEGHTSAVTA